MGRLLDHLLHQQADQRLRFTSCFKRFSATDNRKRFKRLFGQSPRDSG
jgi:hypothetical protein